MDVSFFRVVVESAARLRRQTETLEASIGRSIRTFREHHGVSQAEMARSLGIPGDYLASIEAGRKGVSLDLLERLKDYNPKKRGEKAGT